MPTFTVEEVAKHNSKGDCWIIIDGRVYDVTKFASHHPGGANILLKKGGQDTTKEFKMFHKPESVIRAYGPQLYVGDVQGVSKHQWPSPVPNAAPAKAAAVPASPPVESKQEKKSEKKQAIVKPELFGELTPYADPNWYQGWHSPYYKDSHRRLRAAMREFVDREIIPFCHEWDEAKKLPKEIFSKCYKAGWLPAVIGPPWPTVYAGTNIAGGVKPEEFDAFHELIVTDELSRCGSGGVVWGIFIGLCIGLPPVMHFGSKYLIDKVAGPCLRGEKVICLAITEPSAGSDVAALKTTARLSPCGKYYIVNGEKKWITNGVFADFFTVAVRTGGKGGGGISMLLMEKEMPGITTRQMLCQGVWPSGTTYITFEDVKVPVENLIGKENEGFKYIMYNFNHERWSFAVQSTRFARVCLEEAIRYAMKRETFGKKLIEHPVIRYKLANMARQVEATHASLENVTFQLSQMTHAESNKRLGGPIALLKAQASILLEFCTREAAQIFGGLAYTRGGQGEKVERLYRDSKAYSIPAGSEEIMLDLGVRQALKSKF